MGILFLADEEGRQPVFVASLESTRLRTGSSMIRLLAVGADDPRRVANLDDFRAAALKGSANAARPLRTSRVASG